ncbi:MAG: PH domain-containing protein [Marinicella sp.]|nr:PH domain-containing protein [Xanthomonadales bacterium]
MELKTEGYRLHKSSPLFLFIEAIKKSVIPLAIGIIGTSGDRQDFIILAIATVASIMTIIQFWFYHYWLEEDRLVVKEGILFKSLRQIPYERIQNLNIEKNPLHKLFKVATLQVESASGVKPEAVIRVIADQQVKFIQQTIKNKGISIHADNGQPVGVPINQVSTNSLYKMSNKDVATFGFISHKALVPIGIVFSILSQNDYYRDKFIGFMQKFVGDLHVELWGWSEWLLYGITFGIMTMLVIWLSSIGLAFLKLYQFTLNKEHKNLHAEMGLLTKITANIPIKRIQLIKIKHSPLHRYFRKVSIKMETAGGVTEQSGITMNWIAPLVSRVRGQQVISQIQPEVDWSKIQWKNLEQRAWKRIFKKIMLVILLAMVPLLYFYQWVGILPLSLAPIAFYYAKAYIAHAGYAVNKQVIAYRRGVFFHTISVVKIAKIQNISYMQTPFDRRNQMARITVDTAGSNPVTQDIDLHYLDKKKVLKIQEFLATEVSQSQFVW